MTMTDQEIRLRPEVKSLWTAALLSGDYEQGTGYLTVIDDSGRRDCCLGVLCQLAVDAGVPLNVSIGDDGMRYYDGCYELPPLSVWQWAIGRHDSPRKGATTDFDVRVTDPHEEEATFASSLADQNDNGRDFAGIAALIEEQL